MEHKTKRRKEEAERIAYRKRSVSLDAAFVDIVEEHARALGVSLDVYITNLVSSGLDKVPLPEEQQKIDEFLADPERREWLDHWRAKNALKDPPTMADIAAAHKAEDREARYEYLGKKYSQ